jgi:hypothetical protein
MIKLGIIGNQKQKESIEESTRRSGKFTVVQAFESKATSWEEAYFSSEYDAFLQAVDAVVFCETGEWFAAMVEKALYNFKHIFTDGLKIEESNRLREWGSLVYEAGVVFHAGNQLSVSPSFLSVWPYLRKSNWVDITLKLPIKDTAHFRSILSQGIELALKSAIGGVESFHKKESRLFGLDFPEHFSLWMESAGGTTIQLTIDYSRNEKEITGKFGTHERMFEVDFLAHKVWELQKNTENNSIGALFNNENELELHHLLPEIKKIPKQVIYFDSLSKELLNFWDNITHHLSPLTGINELVEVSVLCEKIYPASGTYHTCP